MLGAGKSAYERLLAIEATSDVSKKTGLGRGTAAVATLGVNLIVTSNRRGDAYLTIRTDRKTHVLHVDSPSASDLKSAKGLEVAGRSLIDTARNEREAGTTMGDEAEGLANNLEGSAPKIPDRLR